MASLPLSLGLVVTVCTLLHGSQATVQSLHGLSQHDHLAVQSTMADVAEILGTRVKRDVDFRYTPQQANQIRESLRTRHRRQIDVTALKWGQLIDYKFAVGSFNEAQKQTIRAAAEQWSLLTCVHFRERASKIDIPDSHLVFVQSNHSCLSYTGRVQNMREHEITLTPSCASSIGPVLHILGHALGLWNEHQRPDRDDFVKVIEENILESPPELAMSLKLKGPADTRVPFDYGSVMLYPARAFSKNGGITLRPTRKNGWYIKTMGQKNSLSFFDVQAINNMYCDDRCTRAMLRGSCRNQGYQDQTDCSRCRCQDGFGGRFCEEVAPSNDYACGRNVIHVNRYSRVNVTSPGYGRQSYYPEGLECNWVVQAPPDHRVVLEMRRENFNVYCNVSCVHWLEIRDSPDLFSTGPRLCCDQRIKLRVRSESRQMMLLFRSLAPSPYQSRRTGFTVSLYAEPQNGVPQGPFDIQDEQTTPPTRPPITATDSPRTHEWTTTRSPAGPSTERSTDYPSTARSTDSPSTTRSTDSPSTTRSTDYPSTERSTDNPSTNPPTTSRTTMRTTETSTTTAAPTTTSEVFTAEQDLVYILDTSNSVSSGEWKDLQDFVKDSTETLTSKAKDTRVGVIVYGSEARTVVNLNSNHGRDYFKGDQWRSVEREGGSSNAADALRQMRQMVGARRRKAGKCLGVLITDGPTSTERENTIPEANELKEEGVNLVVIGVGSRAAREDALEEIRAIASPDKVILVDSYDDLKDEAEEVAEHILKITDDEEDPGSENKEFSDWSCDFEVTSANPSGWCGMLNDSSSDFNWNRTSSEIRGRTKKTGPSRAAGGKGFLYLETSKPRKNGDLAYVYIPQTVPTGKYCLSFKYCMYTAFYKHMGDLTVTTKEQYTSSSHTTIYTIPGRQTAQDWDDDKHWETVKVDIETSGGLVGFCGQRSKGHLGDMALDEIRLTAGEC